ncbi:MAG: hypothetical protein ABEN55_03320 [Bradymonadaceae bacterium]
MLDKTHFSYARGADRCALVTGAETVAIWHIPIDNLGEAYRDGSPPTFELETSRSRLEGVAFVGANRLLTVHQLGECVLWELPEENPEQLPAKTGESETGSDGDETPPEEATAAPESSPEMTEIWTGDLGLEICAFTARSDDDGFARSAAIGARTGEVVLFKFSGDRPTVALTDGHETDVTQINFDPHGYRLASGGRDRRIKLWSTDEETFEPLETKALEGKSAEASGSSKGSESAEASESAGAPDESESSETSGSSEGADLSDSAESSGEDDPSPTMKGEAARELASHRLRCLNTLEGSQGWPLAIAFSHDEQRLATTALDNALYLWDPAADDPLIGVVSRHHNWVTDVAFSPDDARLATGSWDSTVHLVEAESLSPEFRLDVHTDFVSGLDFVPESDRLISTSYDGTMAVWNWRDGELVRQIEAHADWIEVLALVDDRRAFTVSSEDVVRLWDIESGEELAELGDASFEGFQLGRAVDFSSYVEVPELASDQLGEGREPVAAMKAVEKFDERNRPGSEGGSEQTAVGLLENAIGEDAMPASDDALDQQADAADGDGTAMLESKLEESGADTSTSPGPTSPADGVGDEVSQVDAAFAEISDAEADPQDGETGDVSDQSDLLDDRDLKSSVENVGQAIDKRTEEESLDVSADLDEPEEESLDVSPDLDESEETAEAEKSGEATEQDSAEQDGDNDSGTDDQTTADRESVETVPSPGETDAAAGTTGASSDEQSAGIVPSPENSGAGSNTETSEDGRDKGASPTLGKPVDNENSSTDEPAPGATLQGRPDLDISDDSDDTDRESGSETSDPDSTSLQTGTRPTAEMGREGTSGDTPSDQNEAPDDAASADATDGNEEGDERTVDPGELKSKLKKLRDEKQTDQKADRAAETTDAAAGGEEPRRKIREASAAEMWEQRSEAQKSDSSSSPGTDEQTEAVASGDFKLRHTYETPHDVVRGLTSLPGSDLIATCGADGSACLWTLGGRRRLTLTSEESALNGIAFTSDGRILAAASSGAHIHLWLLPDSLQTPDSTIKHTRLKDHEGEVTGVAVDPSGKLLMSGSRDGTARIWSLVDAACMAVLEDHGGPVVDVGWGKLPVTADAVGTIQYWDQEGRAIKNAEGFGDITSVATHETTTCWTNAAGEVYLQTTGQPERRQSHEAAARGAAFGPQGLLATGGADRKLLIYDTGESEPGHLLQCETAVASVFARQNLVGAGGENGRVYLYSRG